MCMTLVCNSMALPRGSTAGLASFGFTSSSGTGCSSVASTSETNETLLLVGKVVLAMSSGGKHQC